MAPLRRGRPGRGSKPMKLLRLLCIFVLMGGFAGSAWAEGAEKRIALVIGIGAYQSAPELPNPPRDARAVAQALRGAGFQVEEVIDPGNRSFATALRGFGIRAAQADVAVIFYAGHGMQVGGQNYLIPADAKLERERDLVYEALPINIMMGELAQVRK